MKKRIGLLIALAMVLCLAGCKDKTKSNRPNMEALKAAEVGSYIYFGEYEQDNNKATGKEAIEWLVLKKEEDRMLVISRYALDCQPYNTELEDVTWETCSLRKWLNSVFYENAFISEEQNVILKSVVTADTFSTAEHGGATPAGNDTVDQVFLLSIDEAYDYFWDKEAILCEGTPYCFEQGAEGSENGYCWWWLRSPGRTSDNAAGGSNGGGNHHGIDDYGCDVNYGQNAVRPAMWIDIRL